MEQTSDTPTPPTATQPQQQEPPAGAAAAPEPAGFRSRGSARRRARFLRKARELGYRDLGGLLFNLHRFGQRNDALVLAKLTTLGNIDTELRALEDVLREHRPVTVLRETGITACPRCAAIHSSEDNFCPNCGFSISHQADLPVAAPSPTATAAPTPQAPVPAEGPSSALPTPSAPPVAFAQAGRSPSPPTAPAAKAPSPTTPSPPAPSDEAGPTEIIRPPVPDS